MGRNIACKKEPVEIWVLISTGSFPKGKSFPRIIRLTSWKPCRIPLHSRHGFVGFCADQEIVVGDTHAKDVSAVVSLDIHDIPFPIHLYLVPLMAGIGGLGIGVYVITGNPHGVAESLHGSGISGALGFSIDQSAPCRVGSVVLPAIVGIGTVVAEIIVGCFDLLVIAHTAFDVIGFKGLYDAPHLSELGGRKGRSVDGACLVGTLYCRCLCGDTEDGTLGSENPFAAGLPIGTDTVAVGLAGFDGTVSVRGGVFGNPFDRLPLATVFSVDDIALGAGNLIPAQFHLTVGSSIDGIDLHGVKLCLA